jgi:hypothetical protein
MLGQSNRLIGESYNEENKLPQYEAANAGSHNLCRLLQQTFSLLSIF